MSEGAFQYILGGWLACGLIAFGFSPWAAAAGILAGGLYRAWVDGRRK